MCGERASDGRGLAFLFVSLTFLPIVGGITTPWVRLPISTLGGHFG